MNADRRDIWEEVWADYDARQLRRVPRPSPASPRPRPQPLPNGWAMPPAAAPRPRIRPLRQLVLALLAALLLLGGWLALPWLLAARISVPIGQGDAPALLRQFDAPVTMARLRADLAAEVPEDAGEGARRFLTGMADRMAESWARPEGVAAWLAVRSRGGRGEGDLPPLTRLRSARPVGLSSFRLEYGPAQGGGVAFELAWQGDAFRVTGMRFLDQPPRPLPRPPVLAMR
jgi:hypothetical protein